MKSKLTTVILLSVLSGILLAPISIVSATKPIEMTVTVTPLVVNLNFEELPSGLVKITFYTEQAWTGDWVGTNRQSGKGIIRTMDRGKDLATIDAFGEFTGTVQDKTGTVIFYMRNNISPKKGFFSAIITILGGTGELENIRGHGTVEAGTLRIWVHFDPN